MSARPAVTRGRRATRSLLIALALVSTVAIAAFAIPAPSGLAENADWPRNPTDAEIKTASDEWMNSKAIPGCLQDSHLVTQAISGWEPELLSVEKFHEKSVSLEVPNLERQVVQNVYEDHVIATCHVKVTHGTGNATRMVQDSYAIAVLFNEGGKWLFRTGQSTDKKEFDANYAGYLKDWVPGWSTQNYEEPLGGTPAGTPKATTAPTFPPMPLCNASIEVPANLKPGDMLSPGVTVTSADGGPLQGMVAPVWYINGVQTNSVKWDGKPAQIVLQLSCQGHGQEFRATYTGGLTPGPTKVLGGTPVPPPPGTPQPSTTAEPTVSGTPAPTGSPSPTPRSRAHAAAPGLGGVGSVPGPADLTQGVLGMVGPGVLGVLGGLLAGLAGGGPAAPAPGSTPGQGPTPGGTEPGGKEPGGKEPGGKEPGGKEPVGKEAPKPAGSPPTSPTSTAPVAGDSAAQAVRGKLDWLSNNTTTQKNPAMVDAIVRAQAEAFDKNGNLIPEKWAAFRQEIRDVGSKTSWLDTYYKLPDFVQRQVYGVEAGVNTLGQFVGEVGGAGVTIVKGVGSGIASAVHGAGQIVDTILDKDKRQMFAKGLDANIKQFVAGSAGAETKESTQALKDGRYLDALGASARGTAKVAGALVWSAGGKVAGAIRDAMPVDEIKSLADPNASTEEKLWAVPAAAVKIAGMLLGTEAGVKPVPGISRNTTFIPSAAPGYAAGQAARAAATEAGAATTSAARAAAEGRQAAAAAAQKVEQTAADVLGGKPAPTNLREGQRLLDQNPELREAIDDAIRADNGSGNIHRLRQVGALSKDAQNLQTARSMQLQDQAANNAGKRIAAEETAGRLANGEPPPRRIITAESTEGNRNFASGANTRTDLDRTHLGLQHVSSDRAKDILNEEIGNLRSGSGQGFTRKAIDTNVYTPPPGRLSDAAGAAPNSDAWLQRSLQRTSGKSGYHPVYVARDGTVTVGDHVGGAAGGEALPMNQQFNSPVQLSAAERAESVAHQLEGLDKAVVSGPSGDVSGGVKFAARAIKDGARFDGPTDAVMRAAMTKDPAEQMAILNEAGIKSVADLRARTGT
jgi:hypothetical protein